MPTRNQRHECANTFNHNEHKNHEPKIINFQGINQSFTIANINNEESKTFKGPETEQIKGTMQLTKIKKALNQIVFTNEDQRLKYVEKRMVFFLTKFQVYYNHYISGISHFTDNKGTSSTKLWKAQKTEKNKGQTG